MSMKVIISYDKCVIANYISVLQAACMKLINNLITNTDELEARCQIRNNFLKLGLQEILMVLRFYFFILHQANLENIRNLRKHQQP